MVMDATKNLILYKLTHFDGIFSSYYVFMLFLLLQQLNMFLLM